MVGVEGEEKHEPMVLIKPDTARVIPRRAFRPSYQTLTTPHYIFPTFSNNPFFMSSAACDLAL